LLPSLAPLPMARISPMVMFFSHLRLDINEGPCYNGPSSLNPLT
jgi:hypothetical protein